MTDEPCQHIWNAHRQCQWCHRMKADIDYEDGRRDARDLLLLVSPNVTPMESLSGLVSQLNNYIAGLKADRDERAVQKGHLLDEIGVMQRERNRLREAIRYWSYCTTSGMVANCPEKRGELSELFIELGVTPSLENLVAESLRCPQVGD